MKPYYEHTGITIYHGDCREILPQLPKVDLVLTDPPYGIGWSQEFLVMSCGIRKDGSRRKYKKWKIPTPRGYVKSKWDNEKIETSLIMEVLEKADKSIMWGGNYYPYPISGGWLVWDKGVVMPTLSKCELAWTNIMEHVEIFKYLWAGFRKEKPEPRDHPTQKPIELMRWCLNFVPEAQSILDPFMGSGTTLRAAKDLNRKAIGIEIEEKYCEIAAERMSQEVLQLNQDARFSDTGEHLTTGASTPLTGN